MRIGYSSAKTPRPPVGQRSETSYCIDNVDRIEIDQDLITIYTTTFPFRELLAQRDDEGWQVLNMRGEYEGPCVVTLREGR